MAGMSENTIKHLALGYLKSFYRYRPRAEGSVSITNLDMRLEGGIIADGFMRYIQPDNLPFTITFEATSQETRDEILYRPRFWHVFWDAAAFGFLVLPCTMAIAHLMDYYPLVEYGFWPAIGLLFGSAFLWIALYYLLFRRLPRYRYIFAVEQFKQYPANDQWVAYSYDVFNELPSKYHRELVHQCTRYGFGLVEINAQRKPRLVLAPSRAEIFVPKRQLSQFLQLGQWQKMAEELGSKPWQKIKKRFQETFRPYRSRYFRWFPRTYPNQWSIIAIGFMAAFYFFRLEYQLLPVIKENPITRAIELSQIPQRSAGEPEFFRVDAPEPGFFDSAFSPYIPAHEEEQFAELIQVVGSTHADSIDLPPIRIMTGEPGQDVALYYDCDRIRQLSGDFYVVADTVVPSLAIARQRIQEWNDQGFSATAIWPTCLGGPNKGFFVYLDAIIIDSTEAHLLRDSFQQQLDSLAAPLQLRKFYAPRQ